VYGLTQKELSEFIACVLPANVTCDAGTTVNEPTVRNAATREG
jgi:hypothetical protein